MKAAIIGGGVTGSSILKGLLEHDALQPDDHITIFEPRKIKGAGMPYTSDDETLMLNSAPDTLSADRTDATHFERWLALHRPEAKNFEGLIPRAVYGEYLVHHFAPYYEHPQVTVIQENVDNVCVLTGTREGGPLSYHVSTQENGWRETVYDALFFAIGHAPYKDPYQLQGNSHYIANPYPVSEKLERIGPKSTVGIIGSGATGIDMMRTLMQTKDLVHPVTFYVKNHAFHMIHIPLTRKGYSFGFSEEWIHRQQKKHDGRIPLQIILDQIAEDFEKEDVDVRAVYRRYQCRTLQTYRNALDKWDQELAYVQRYVQRLIPYLARLYNALPEVDKLVYDQKYHYLLEFFKSMVPAKTFQWMFDLMKEGRLRVVTGLREVVPQQNGRSFKVGAEETEEVDWLINAAGFEKTISVAMREQPLIQNLYRQKLILPAKNGKDILVDWPHTRIVNERFGIMDNAFFLGNWISSTHYANNSAENVMDHASFLAGWFMEQRHTIKV